MQTDSISMNRAADGNKILSIISKVYLALNLAVYGGFTVGFFILPVRLASLIGIEIRDSAALADFRAMYGGLCLGISAIFILGWFKEEFKKSSIVLALTAAVGLLSGRIYTLLLDGPGNEYIYISMATEIGAIVIGTWLLKRS
ncbi:DUF4345 family protein [Leptospira barantonii]|uniref:DUF4345 domain-containing protein n=1 Tax=Leptospira barantonii TaxID=2023184 RepID=A0ABX4NM42_9LEPT|nr:DUF4345 family protein [Leptospira barantonii]PJZ57803.1 hypothetical protein CH367_05225 [Leptospira barantonii]